MNRDREREEEENRDESNSGIIIAGVLGAAAALAGGLYWWSTRNADDAETPQRLAEERNKRRPTQQGSSFSTAWEASRSSTPAEASSTSLVSNLLGGIANMDLDNYGSFESVSRFRDVLADNPDVESLRARDVPVNPYINNLDTLLHDIYVRFIALKDFDLYYKVFDTVLLQLHRHMKKVDLYYNRYSSTVQLAGSHYDRLRIEKPDEFDVDIIIGMPLNIRVHHSQPDDSDIILEDMSSGYVKLKMGTQFQKLPYRDEWQVNKTLYSWRDDGNYLLRSKFSDWFKSLVYRAMNEFEGYGTQRSVIVDGVSYNLGVSQSGPAMTLKITNSFRGFNLAVDLVPALKFPESRWPSWGSYRKLQPPYSHEIFMVVPKPIKKEGYVNDVNVNRSWRMSLIHQEKQLLHDTYHLRQIIRYMKKLRHVLEMDGHIASYYIKTLFLWEVYERNDFNFWQQAPSKLFIIMVKKFKEALDARKILYFWNKTHNLIGNVRAEILVGYANKLKKLIQVLENPAQYVQVADYLLTKSELKQYEAILDRAIR